MKRIIIPFLFFTTLLICDAKMVTAQIKVEQLAESTVSWDGTPLPNYPTDQPKITILKISIPPHAKLEWHKHLVINAGVMLKGNLRVENDEGDLLELKTGDTIIELFNKWHYGENVGDEPAVIVVFYAGTEQKPLTIIKEG